MVVDYSRIATEGGRNLNLKIKCGQRIIHIETVHTTLKCYYSCRREVIPERKTMDSKISCCVWIKGQLIANSFNIKKTDQICAGTKLICHAILKLSDSCGREVLPKLITDSKISWYVGWPIYAKKNLLRNITNTCTRNN